MATTKMASDANEILKNFGGIDKNNLNNLVMHLDDIENTITVTANSPYIDTEHLVTYMSNYKNKFTVLNLNIQSLNAKHDALEILLKDLKEHDIEFSAICLQETWHKDKNDLHYFHLPNYTCFDLVATCSKHGGLIIFLHNAFHGEVLNTYEPSNLWEGLFIKVSNDKLKHNITLGNIYRLPKDRNAEINSFLEQLAPVITSLNASHDTILTGDFNIDLLKVNTRNSYSSVLEFFYTQSFLPVLNLPTRFSNKNATLIDQIYYKPAIIENIFSFHAGIVFSQISDHLPTIFTLDQTIEPKNTPKYITKREMNDQCMEKFKNQLNSSNLPALLNSITNPNESYKLFDDTICKAYEKHFPLKRTKFKKYKHKKNMWITLGILKALKERDKLYRKIKSASDSSPLKNRMKQELKERNSILNRCIKLAKQSYYKDQFTKYQTDSKKTWDTIKLVLNLKNTKDKFHSFFIINNSK
jgi:hypothetical protein